MAGPFAAALAASGPAEGNLILRAARALAGASGREPADLAIDLDKRLPVGGGIGGGSADAAATLRLLQRRWRIDLAPDRLTALATSLGADVAMCLASVPLRARGIGDLVTPVEGWPVLPLVLANPGIAVRTPAVFARLTPPRDPPLPHMPAPIASATEAARWLETTRNGLTEAAIAEAPAIADVLAALAGLPGCLLARMSGSGPTCFGLFHDTAASAAAAALLAAAQPAWWVVATQSGPSPGQAGAA